MMNKFLGAAIAAMALVGGVQAGTANVPDPAVIVSPNSATTIVIVNGKTYRGSSNFVYFSECAKPDGPRFHCSVSIEDVVLVSVDGSVAVVEGLAVQFAGVLITSGHNYWRNTTTVLSGQVTTP